MKTQIDGFNIDLNEVAFIGPLTADRNTMTDLNEIKGLGCFAYLKNGRNLWLNMSRERIDPYQLDDAKNAFTRAEAQANYNRLVEEWKAD